MHCADGFNGFCAHSLCSLRVDEVFRQISVCGEPMILLTKLLPSDAFQRHPALYGGAVGKTRQPD